MQEASAEMEAKQSKYTKAQKELIIDESLQDLLNAMDAKIEEQNATVFVKKKNFTASDTIGCQRRWVYLFRGLEMQKITSAQGYRRMENGTQAHERVGKYLSNLGVVVASEEEFWLDSPPIHGFIDFVIDWRGLKVVEFKSINDAGYQYRKLYAKPKDEHFMQIQIYMEIKNCEEGIILYENKNDQEFLPFVIKRDQAFIDELFTKWRKTWAMYQNGELPKRPARTRESKICTYCELKDKCWNDSH